MKLMFLTQYYPPEIGAPQARISELASRMQRRGHEITILTAMPNYPTGEIFPEYQGKKYVEEIQNELRVIRTWIYPTKSTTIVKRFLNYFSFVFSSILYGRKLEKQDIIVVESPPLFLGLAGIFLSKALKAKLLFNVSDLWPDSAVEIAVVNEYSLLVSMSKKLENLCYSKADAITGQSATIVNTIRTRAPMKNVELITNGVDVSLFSPDKKNNTFRQKHNLKNKFVLVYAGLFGIAQGLGQILDAAKLLIGQTDLVFLLVGDGPEKEMLLQRVKQEGLTNVIISESITKTEVPYLLSSMDAAIIPLKTSINGAVPSKIYENMASGLPILFIGDGDGADIIINANAGIVLKPYDCLGLMQAINKLYIDPELRTRMGDNGAVTVRNVYSRDKIADTFENLIKKLFVQNDQIRKKFKCDKSNKRYIKRKKEKRFNKM